MLFVRSAQHLTTLFLITAYGLVLAWYIVFGANPNHRCIYAVRPVLSPNTTAPIWTKVDKSMVLLAPQPLPPQNAHERICYANLINGKSVALPTAAGEMSHSVMYVCEAVNCLRSLWYTEMRLIVASWFMYLAFVALYQRRRMFGVVSPAQKMVAPATYLLNYAGRIVSSVLLKFPYTKITRLLCELSVQRQSLVQLFEADPITFLYHRPTIGCIVGCEILLRLGAQGLIMGTALVTWGECAITYPLFLSIATWCFVSIITLLEMYAMLRKVGSPPHATPAATSTRKSGLRSICGRCCSIILSGIAVRLCYVAIVAVVVIIVLHYEQEIQRRLFET
ncbi:envelope glycoprotein K [Pteropodid alphaherpesvirus 1]|uniref:Envelope glycoprotein K n=1 Tax=Pteropodid alphaherpesvirus 1 TaxID=1343901 RepID=A0A060PYC0_9ALPH|nr:envelope glycoprotein K [Pteropodid alphaherpesvirus 1]BAP00733.1 envelope glycoprotein K [Pteropodid alphaherpesvirus 1]